MKKNKIGLFIGIVMLVAGLIIFIWSGGTEVSSNPYISGLLSYSQRGQTILLLNTVGKFLAIFGGILTVLGIISSIYVSHVAKDASQTQTTTSICPSCGVKVDKSMQTCPNCGKELK